ncbi:hypothetical protein SLE2022_136740 [Rubroshorea leprosula]
MEDCWGSDEEYGEDSLNEMEMEDEESDRRTVSSTVITKDSLLAAQKEDLRKVMDLLSLKEHHARTLLIHYQWDVERLIAVLVEKGKSRLFSEVGVSMVECREDNNSTSVVPSVIFCEICMEEFSGGETSRMECGHCYCIDCWTEHFIVKINEGQSRRIRCMAYKCHAICDEAIVRDLVRKRHDELAEKFDRFLLESYIEDNKMVKWCPSIPHCGNAIRVEDDDEFSHEVQCCCGVQFCFNCLSEAHSPCSCSMWKLWMNKCQDESETVNWITINTKPCPKCGKLVEKNGGCNLVACVCGQPFCWLCGEATGRNHTWEKIEGHSCGRYEEEHMRKIELANQDLHRYMHYYNRYKAHKESFLHESGKLRESILEKVSNSEAREWSLRDFSWVTDGLYRLLRSRQALSYSYPFAYYMFGKELFQREMTMEVRKMRQNLFEDQQQQLESNVEKLSKILEVPFDEYADEEVLKVRMQVMDQNAIVDRLCKKMYECIENDLLGSINVSHIHNIAPYKSKGIEKASQLSADDGSTGCYNRSTVVIRYI